MRIILTALACVGATMAQSDEMWTTPYGQAIYLSDVDGAAIFEFEDTAPYPVYVVIPGLPSQLDNRGDHAAFWISEGSITCDASLGFPTVPNSQNWGQALVSFDEPTFPSSFTLTVGDCFEPMTRSLRAITSYGD